MSSNDFNYAYTEVRDFVSTLEKKLVDIPIENIDVYNKLKKIRNDAMAFSIVMQQVEKLYDGDIDEDTFLSRMKDMRR